MVDFKMKYGQRIISKAELEIWDNPNPERDYEINITFPEFTCLCPRSGYPDFASIVVKYVPSQKIVELKSLKLYLNAFRDVPISHEEVTNRIYSVLSRNSSPASSRSSGTLTPGETSRR